MTRSAPEPPTHAAPPFAPGEPPPATFTTAATSAFAAPLGATALRLATAGRELFSVFVRTLYFSVRGKREPGALARQMYEIGNRSVFFLSVTSGFIGMILIYQAGLQAARVVPDYSLLGATYLQLLVRDLAASLGALMLATRVGAGIAAEIGSMVVTEQVDALRMCAADPIDFLVVPRFLASLVMTAVLVVWGGFVSFCAAAATAYFAFGVGPFTFFNPSLVTAGDLVTGLAKCLAYGAAIPVVSSYCGLSTFGGSEGVGWATTRAVVNSSLAIIILDAVLSVAAFLVFPT
jgi:phospholipid/cholesterol/gamma-HCH transport system permease protein